MRVRPWEGSADTTAMQQLAGRLWPRGLHPGGVGWEAAVEQLPDETALAVICQHVAGWAGLSAGRAGQRALLIRRNNATGELAYYRCYAPAPVSLATLVRVAGRRWTVQESFQAGKGLAGLDQHQVRRWNSWHRWTTLARLASSHPRRYRARPNMKITKSACGTSLPVWIPLA
jgi:hypothetical protein